MGNTTSTLRRIIVAGCIGMVQLNVAEIKNQKEYKRIYNLEAGVPHGEHGKFIWTDTRPRRRRRRRRGPPMVECDIVGVIDRPARKEKGPTKMLHIRGPPGVGHMYVFWDEKREKNDILNPQDWKMKVIWVAVVDGKLTPDVHDHILDHKGMTYVAKGQPESPKGWKAVKRKFSDAFR